MKDEQIKVTQEKKTVDIPGFMSNPRQYYSIEKTEFDRMLTMHQFRTKLSFLNGLAIGATSVSIIILIVAVVIGLLMYKPV